MKLSKIQIVFENCEIVNLSSDMINLLIFEEITENKYIHKSLLEDLEIEVHKGCEYMIIVINSKGCKQKMKMQDITLEERITTCNDIVNITLIYEDNTEEKIFVKWNEENEFINKYQKIEKLENEAIRVEIGK